MPDPRWTDETERLINDVARRWLLMSEPMNPGALVLTALADAGLLVEPGGESYEQIEVQTPGLRYPVSDLASAWRQYGESKARGSDVSIVTRTVHAGPWREVQP